MRRTPEPAESRAPEHVRYWNALLQDSALAEASAAGLREGQARRDLAFGDRPLSIALRPNLLSAGRLRQAWLAGRAVHSALMTLEKALLADPALRAELDLDPREERLALADQGCRLASPVMRLDSFFADDVRYVECNAESPAGMAFEDNLAATFRALPVTRRFRERYRMRALPARRRLLESLLRSFREWRRDASPSIAIVDWSGLPTASEFELLRDHFERAGVPALVCEPSDLEFGGGRLHASGRPVNLVYKRVLTSELLARPEAARPIVDAYLAGAALVLNTFRAKLLHVKGSLALLSDERLAPLFTASQRKAVARHVPWTRRLREGPAARRGERVRDLLELARAERERMVLKPNDDYGGRGVVLGWTVTESEWERALGRGLESAHVVQEAVPVPREPFPVIGDGTRMLDLAIDMDPYLFHGRPGGVLTRLSSSELLNVTAGAGSIVPTFVVEARG